MRDAIGAGIGLALLVLCVGLLFFSPTPAEAQYSTRMPTAYERDMLRAVQKIGQELERQNQQCPCRERR